MSARDPHQALKHEVIQETHAGTTGIRLARLQWGKNDVGFSLHVNPNSWTTSGFQLTDFLSLLGFERSQCSFFDGQQCYVRWVDEGFNVATFAQRFEQAFGDVTQAHRHLESCGIFLDQPEGWGYFYGKRSGRSRADFSTAGDGHTATETKSMKQAEDETFLYRFSWIVSGRGKGWVIHYRPKHPPLSSELQNVFSFLGINAFAECPEYEFESCHWRSIAYQERGDRIFDSNAETAHRWFDAHAAQFSPGIEKLLRANATLEEVGLRFLPIQAPAARLSTDIEKRTARPASRTKRSNPETFDVAISFAGTEREHAQFLATMLQEAGYSVFYDDFYPEFLWGKNLVDTFDEIYRKRARYCVIFVSKTYRERAWTNHERQSAQARALTEKGREYILPIKVDDTELDGMPPTIGHMPLSAGIDKIGELLIKKLKS